MRSFHVLSNPVGSLCNLDCKYCYYLEKEGLSDSGEGRVMSDEVLENFVRQYILQQRGLRLISSGKEVNRLWLESIFIVVRSRCNQNTPMDVG